jgi:hypothetical protein
MNRVYLAIAVAFVMVAGITLTAWVPAHAATEPVQVKLEAENNSGETGTATLTDLGNGKTMVEVSLTGEPDGASQPMHIHQGQCGPTLGQVAFPLTNLENGKSTTTIDAALETLTTGGFAINGHKSAQEISVYVFCGNIPSADAMMMANETATSDAMMMQATTTPEAAMANETATSDAMMMAEATATHEAMMAQPTATSDAMMTQETTTPEAAMANETPTPAPPATVPTTGGTDNSNLVWGLGVLGILAIGAGIALRRVVRGA